MTRTKINLKPRESPIRVCFDGRINLLVSLYGWSLMVFDPKSENMGKLQTTDYEDWEEIGKIVQQVNHDVVALVSLLNSIPKSEWNDEHRKACEGMSELKDVLEERMAKEHSDKWDTHVFYGEIDKASWKKMDFNSK